MSERSLSGIIAASCAGWKRSEEARTEIGDFWLFKQLLEAAQGIRHNGYVFLETTID